MAKLCEKSLARNIKMASGKLQKKDNVVCPFCHGKITDINKLSLKNIDKVYKEIFREKRSQKLNKNMNIFRQGDLVIKPIEKLPENLKVVSKGNQFVLAEGEQTGHKHLLVAEKLEVLQDEKGRYYFQLQNNATITHEEHKTITILPGIYEVGNEQEYDYFLREVRQVND